jgi:hypothetical protein
MFPFSRRGILEVPGLEPDLALDRLRVALEKADARNLRRDGSRLVFYGGIFRFVGSWNILCPISTGEISASPMSDGAKVTYRLSFVEILVVVSLMLAFMAGIAPGNARAESARMLLLGWSWLVGGNYLLTAWRFPRFLRRAVSAPHHTHALEHPPGSERV